MAADSYVIVITKSQPVGRLKGHQIYKIAATEFMPLRERQVTDPDEEIYLAYIKAQRAAEQTPSDTEAAELIAANYPVPGQQVEPTPLEDASVEESAAEAGVPGE